MVERRGFEPRTFCVQSGRSRSTQNDRARIPHQNAVQNARSATERDYERPTISPNISPTTRGIIAQLILATAGGFE
jgi:hypothetical protein